MNYFCSRLDESNQKIAFSFIISIKIYERLIKEIDNQRDNSIFVF